MIKKGRRLLIIDQRDKWLSLAKSALSEAGYDVRVARSVQNARDILVKEGNRFDLILADQKVVEQERDMLREMIWVEPDKRRRVVVVFPTEFVLPEMRKVFELGVYDCVDKQYDPDKLIRLVEDVFEHPTFERVTRLAR